MISFHHIHHTEDRHWAAFTAIYGVSFPIDEQRPTTDIARLITEEERYRAMALVDDNDRCIGLLTAWQFPTYSYIEHFAIDPSLRSKGYGTMALKTFAHTQPTPIVLEVEPPTDVLTLRRIGFYERCGLALYDYDYIQPSYAPDRSAVPLRLMGTPASPDLAHIARTLHSEVYGVNNTDK